MLVKIHKNQQGRTIVAVCDKSVAGKKFEENTTQLDLTTDFYKGEEAATEMIADIMRNADIVNMVGEKAIGLGIKEGIVAQEDVKTVQGIPHAQIVLLD